MLNTMFAQLLFPAIAWFVLCALVVHPFNAPMRLRLAAMGALLVGEVLLFLKPPVAWVLMSTAVLSLAGFSVVHKWQQRRRTLALIVVVIALETLLLIASNRERHYWDGWELNQDVSSSDVIGVWVWKDQSITISSDGTFTTSTDRQGKWSIQPIGHVLLHDDDWAAVRHDGQLVLVHCTDPDPDSCNLGRAFTRRGPVPKR